MTRERGFTLTELAIATVVLVVGAVAVMQLVPAAMQSNLNNRYDTTSAVAVQRLRDLMVSQAMWSNTLTDPNGQFPCGAAVVCNLGDPNLNDQPVGARLTAAGEIDFSQAPVAGYSFIYVDPNDPSQTQYDVRWAVVTNVRNVGNLTNIMVGKRLIIGARSRSDRTPFSVTFVSWITR